jgi:Tol biopolymer transport system component
LLLSSVLLSNCKQTGTTDRTSGLQLKRISVPERVFSIGGEVLAFEATGETGRTAEVSLSLRQLQGRFGKFQRALVYEYNKEGRVLSHHEVNVSTEMAIAMNATTGNRYLVFGDLGQRFRNSYQVACGLRRAGLSGPVVPRLCSQIFCTDEVFQAAQLRERVPELKEKTVALGEGLIGGFGGTGNICDQCLSRGGSEGDFIPAAGCSDRVPVVPEITLEPEVIVYTHSQYPATSDFNWQIWKVKSDGTGGVNLSNNEEFEMEPDVNHATKRIVFAASGPAGVAGLTIMDLDGNNRTVIPGTAPGSDPKWSRGGESFVIYTNLAANPNNALFRVRPDGSDNVEIVRAGAGLIIRTADLIDNDHVVFAQDSGTFDGELFIKDIGGDGEVINITKTPKLHESYPVVSHDGTMIAYQVDNPNDTEGMEIHVARIILPFTLQELHVFRLGVPAGRWLSGLDFSSDDKRIYVSSTYIDTENTTNSKQLFSVNLDGSGQVRITTNDESDLWPSVVPR